MGDPAGRARNRALARSGGLWCHIDRIRLAQKRLTAALATDHGEIGHWRTKLTDAHREFTRRFRELEESRDGFIDPASAPGEDPEEDAAPPFPEGGR